MISCAINGHVIACSKLEKIWTYTGDSLAKHKGHQWPLSSFTNWLWLLMLSTPSTNGWLQCSAVLNMCLPSPREHSRCLLWLIFKYTRAVSIKKCYSSFYKIHQVPLHSFTWKTGDLGCSGKGQQCLILSTPKCQQKRSWQYCRDILHAQWSRHILTRLSGCQWPTSSMVNLTKAFKNPVFTSCTSNWM